MNSKTTGATSTMGSAQSGEAVASGHGSGSVQEPRKGLTAEKNDGVDQSPNLPRNQEHQQQQQQQRQQRQAGTIPSPALSPLRPERCFQRQQSSLRTATEAIKDLSSICQTTEFIEFLQSKGLEEPCFVSNPFFNSNNLGDVEGITSTATTSGSGNMDPFTACPALGKFVAGWNNRDLHHLSYNNTNNSSSSSNSNNIGGSGGSGGGGSSGNGNNSNNGTPVDNQKAMVSTTSTPAAGTTTTTKSFFPTNLSSTHSTESNQGSDPMVALVFHGTAESNVDNILQYGLDPNRRRGQAFGPGEYFAFNPIISHSYCKGGKKLLVFAVVVPPEDTTSQAPQSQKQHNGLTPKQGQPSKNTNITSSTAARRARKFALRKKFSVVIVENNLHQIPLGYVSFKSMTRKALARAAPLINQFKLQEKRLQKKLEAEQKIRRENEVKATIIHHVINDNIDKASMMYMESIDVEAILAAKEAEDYREKQRMVNNGIMPVHNSSSLSLMEPNFKDLYFERKSTEEARKKRKHNEIETHLVEDNCLLGYISVKEISMYVHRIIHCSMARSRFFPGLPSPMTAEERDRYAAEGCLLKDNRVSGNLSSSPMVRMSLSVEGAEQAIAKTQKDIQNTISAEKDAKKARMAAKASADTAAEDALKEARLQMRAARLKRLEQSKPTVSDRTSSMEEQHTTK